MKQKQHYQPLLKTGNETNDSECYFCFVKKNVRKKEKLSCYYVVGFAQTLNNTFDVLN